MSRRLLGLAALAAIAPAVLMVNRLPTVTTNLGLSMIVPQACTVSTTAVAFPNTDVGNVTANGTITVNCGVGAGYNVQIDAGMNFGGARRRLKHSSQAQFADYQLFSDAAMTIEWGDASLANTYPAGFVVGGVGNGADQVLTVYALVLAFAGLPPGTYLDTDLVTVTF